MIVPESLKKIFEIDSHIAVTASGLIADARRLVESARVDAQRHRITYNENADVETIARSTCDLMQVYTQYGGIRPFGVSLLIGGYDNKPRLFEAEPSGAMTAYRADAIGASKKEVDEILERRYRETMDVKEAIRLAIEALKRTQEEKLNAENVEISYIGENRKHKTLSDKDVLKYIKE